MWYSALLASMRARGSGAAVPAPLERFVALAERLGLRPDHGIAGPYENRTLVNRALEAFAKEWTAAGDERTAEQVGRDMAQAITGVATSNGVGAAPPAASTPLQRLVSDALRRRPLPSELLAGLT